MRAPSRREAATSTASVRRLRLLTPMIRAPLSIARVSSSSSWTSTSAARPSSHARRCSRTRSAWASAATIRSAASAPFARASSNWYSSTMKSLRRSGKRHRLAHGGQMLQRAIEERRFGEHRDRRRAARFVLSGNRHRVVAGGQHAARRRTPLALGDDIRPPWLRQRRQERVAARRGAPRPAVPARRGSPAHDGPR